MSNGKHKVQDSVYLIKKKQIIYVYIKKSSEGKCKKLVSGCLSAGVRAGVPSPLGCCPRWAAAMELSADYLREKLQRDLEAEHVEVEDTTPNRCASSFRVLVVSAKFEGKPLLQRHR